MPSAGTTGVSTHQQEFLRYLRKSEGEVALVSSWDIGRLALRIHRAPGRIASLFNDTLAIHLGILAHCRMMALMLRKELADGRPCLIYAQTICAAIVAQRVRRSCFQKVILAVHFNRSVAEEVVGQRHISRLSRLYAYLKSAQDEAVCKADGLVFFSEYMRLCVENQHPQAAQVPSAVIPNFVAAPNRVRTEIERDLISIGTLETRKNQTYLLHVVAACKKDGHRYTLTLCGDGPDRQMLERLAAELDIKDQVEFRGFVPNARNFIASHRMYVHSAVMESFGIALLEALAYAKPVAAGAVGGIPEVFSNGIEGIHWPLDDAETGARMLISILEDESNYARMSCAALETYERKFPSSVVAERLRQFLYSFFPTRCMNPEMVVSGR
jgi:glycosyltransferase involved in cell wall biosynthesis